MAKVNEPLAETARLSPPFFCNTRPLPVRPLTLPPIGSGAAVTVSTALLLKTRPAPL